MALVAVKNLSFHYDDKPALKDVSFSLREGEFAVLTGPSGSGKSTLLRILKKEVAPKGRLAGEILIFNRPGRAFPAPLRGNRICHAKAGKPDRDRQGIP